jgi:pimeloyl-ACP methyl ester carboxylesterase
MTLVLVHGVPEDAHIWNEIRAELTDIETVALNLPGFGSPLPAGVKPTMNGYADWLCQQLAAFSAPVCLVGHDWGGILTSRIATTRPDLIRAFATDVLSFFNPSFTWHPLAKIWATPGDGEEFMRKQSQRTPEERAAQYTQMGVSSAYATRLAVTDACKDSCILQLYRSSVSLYADWGKDAQAPTKPGIQIMGAKDPFAAPALAESIRVQFGMPLELLDDVGHFWPSEAPRVGAAVLRKFYRQYGC